MVRNGHDDNDETLFTLRQDRDQFYGFPKECSKKKFRHFGQEQTALTIWNPKHRTRGYKTVRYTFEAESNLVYFRGIRVTDTTPFSILCWCNGTVIRMSL